MVNIGFYRSGAAIRVINQLWRFSNMDKKAIAVISLFFLLAPFVFAQASGDIGQITAPLNKIYDLAKAVVSVVALLALTYAGARFMFSGDDLKSRENAKGIVTYAIAGLVLVWVAPLLVNFLTAPPA